MNDFPEFMRNDLNAVNPAQQTPGNIGYVFDGIDGSQMAIWTCHRANVSKEHVHDFDEYFVVVSGRYSLFVGEEANCLGPGDEYHIKRGVPHCGEAIAGTRMIHAFGNRRAERKKSSVTDK